MAKEGTSGAALNLNDTVKDALRLLILDGGIRRQLIEAFTEDDRLHLEELNSLLEVISQSITIRRVMYDVTLQIIGDDINPQQIVSDALAELPRLSSKLANDWSDSILSF